MNELENLRERIDTIDKELIALFEERMNVVNDIAEYKIKNKLSLKKSRFSPWLTLNFILIYTFFIFVF